MTDGRQAVTFSPMRRAIARRMVDSKQAAPHFYLSTQIDMSAVLDASARENAGRAQDERVTVTTFLLRAVALTLEAHPGFNAVWAGVVLQLVSRVNIGVAIALDDGLIAPALLDCARKSVGELAAELSSLSERARAGRLRAAEISAIPLR